MNRKKKQRNRMKNLKIDPTAYKNKTHSNGGISNH